MKSASEILQKHRQPLNDMGEDMVYYSHAIQAMNEFADQFKNPSPASPVPVKEEGKDYTYDQMCYAINMGYHHGLKVTGMDGKIKRKIIEQIIKLQS